MYLVNIVYAQNYYYPDYLRYINDKSSYTYIDKYWIHGKDSTLLEQKEYNDRGQIKQITYYRMNKHIEKCNFYYNRSNQLIAFYSNYNLGDSIYYEYENNLLNSARVYIANIFQYNIKFKFIGDTIVQEFRENSNAAIEYLNIENETQKYYTLYPTLNGKKIANPGVSSTFNKLTNIELIYFFTDDIEQDFFTKINYYESGRLIKSMEFRKTEVGYESSILENKFQNNILKDSYITTETVFFKRTGIKGQKKGRKVNFYHNRYHYR